MSDLATRALTLDLISPSIGAEVTDVDLADADDDLFAAIHQAMLDHKVLAIRDQGHLTPEQHKAFASRWGELDIHGYAPAISDEHPEILDIKNGGKKFTITEAWHTDVTWKPRPPLTSLLLARRIPASGGDTMFSNLELAYDSLTDAMKEMLAPLTAEHGPPAVFMKMSGKDATDWVTHPVIRTHPETGRKAIYVNVAFTKKFTGMTTDESRPLLEWLFERCHRPDFTCRIQWEPGTLVMWDNRCTQHYAIHDHGDEVRDMHRVTVLDSLAPA